LKRIWFATALFFATIAPAFAWGAQGHHAIGDLARTLLTPKARAHVVAILGNDDLGAIASWADDVRSADRGSGPLVGDADAALVNSEFPHNASWHFVDLPLGMTRYPSGPSPFTSDNDIVHAINRCLGVLDGTGPKTPPQLSKLDALKFLAHFCGDITMPFHVSSGYYRVDPDGTVHLVTDPAAAVGLPDDRGGNSLFFGPDRYDELHGYWDFDMVKDYAGTSDPEVLASKLAPLVNAKDWADSGDYHQWAAHWAADSLIAARSAYQGFTFGKAEVGSNGNIQKIPIVLDLDSYTSTNEPLAGQQLAKGGFRLAEILNRLWK
jgi:hypothetical protein